MAVFQNGYDPYSRFSPDDPTQGIGGGIQDGDGGMAEMPPGRYFNDELEFQDPRRAAMGAALMQLGMPRSKRSPGAVLAAVQGARQHNTRMRRLMEPRYQVSGGKLFKFDGSGNFLGAEDFAAGEGNRKTIQGADGFQYFVDTGERVLPNVQASPGQSERRIVTGADGYQYFVDDGSRVLPGVEQATPGMDMNQMVTASNTLRDDLRTDLSPYATAADQYRSALALANTYADDNATDEQKAQADIGLVQLTAKTWDPRSAVLSGEYDNVASANDAFGKAQSLFDSVSAGAKLTEAQRKGMLKLLGSVWKGKEKQAQGVYGDYLQRTSDQLGNERLPWVFGQDALTQGPNGYELSNNPMVPLNDYQQGINWINDYLPGPVQSPFTDEQAEDIGTRLQQYIPGVAQ